MKYIVIPLISFFIFSQRYRSAAENQSIVDTVKIADTSKITYKGNVQPLMIKNCSPCHFPPEGNGEYIDTYAKTKESIDDILGRINQNPGDDGFMPRKHDKLKDSIINIFARWRKGGMAE